MGKKKLETFWSKSMYLPTAQRLSHASRKDNECSTSRAVQAILKEYKEGADPELLFKLGVDKMKVGAALLGLLPSVASVLVSSDCRSTSFIIWAVSSSWWKSDFLREGEGSLYDHSLTLLMDGRNVSLSELSGKVSIGKVSSDSLLSYFDPSEPILENVKAFDDSKTHRPQFSCSSYSIKVTLVQIFLWMLVLPRWFSSPMF